MVWTSANAQCMDAWIHDGWMEGGRRMDGCAYVMSCTAMYCNVMDVFAPGPRWEFPKIRGSLFWGPNKDPTI